MIELFVMCALASEVAQWTVNNYLHMEEEVLASISAIETSALCTRSRRDVDLERLLEIRSSSGISEPQVWT